MIQPIEANGDKWDVVGQALAGVVFLGAIGFGVSTTAGLGSGSRQHTSSAPVVVAGGTLSVDGATYKVTTSEFTPKGRFTIGKKYFDPVIGVESFPFLIEDWRKMDDRNPLKRRIEQREKATGQKQSVAYAIHAGMRSHGCVTLPGENLNKFKGNLEGRSIEIK